MPRSRSWRNFLQSRSDLVELLKLASAQSETLQPHRRLSDQESHLRLIMVALVGQMQNYIAELLEELTDGLPESWERLTPVQKRYVAVQIRRHIESLVEDHSETDLADRPKVEEFVRSFLTCAEWPNKPSSLAASPHRQSVHGFLRENNSRKAIDRAISQFRPDGMKFADWLGATSGQYRDAFERLDNAIRVRNEVAHGRIGQRLTLRDVRGYRALIYRLVQKADEYLEHA